MASGTAVQFIESRFQPDETEKLIRSTFSEVRDVTFTPMTLRAIFLAMAKSGRRMD
jgi:hypothetical protein